MPIRLLLIDVSEMFRAAVDLDAARVVVDDHVVADEGVLDAVLEADPDVVVVRPRRRRRPRQVGSEEVADHLIPGRERAVRDLDAGRVEVGRRRFPR